MESPLHPRTIFQGWRLFLCGICMGAADLVPGISGGTIAFILGFYEPLLTNLKTFNSTAFDLLLTRKWKQLSDHIPWRFFLTLFAGILFAFVCLANFLHFILGHELYRIYLYAVFFGLIAASFIFCIRQVTVWNERILAGLLFGALLGFLLSGTGFQSISKGEYAIEITAGTQAHSLVNYKPENSLLTGLTSQDLSILLSRKSVKATSPVFDRSYKSIGVVSDFSNTKDMPHWFDGWLVLCGICAICGLLLPGISGSYILTLLGAYPIVMEALVDFLNALGRLNFHLEAFSILISLAVGILAGSIIFSRLIGGILKHYPDQALSILSGIMIGSIRTVWPFQTYEYALVPLKLHKGAQLIALNPFLPPYDSTILWSSIAFAFGGFSIVFILDACAKSAKDYCEVNT